MIVVGVNERPAARDALALGGWLGAALGEDLLLVFVHGVERPPSKLGTIVRTPTLVRRRLEAGAIETAVRALAKDTAAALPPGLRCELRLVAADSPASGLARVAHEERASMLVLGTSERAGVGRILPGSTAIRLLSGDSSAPVAIAPRHYIDRLPHAPLIGVGFDGGPEARLALASADRLARAVGGRLRVAAVHEPAAFSHVGVGAMASESVGQALRRQLRSEVEQAIAEYCQTTSPETVFLHGDPATELAGLSAELDLLVLGSRGHGPVRSVLLGSVSAATVAGSEAPVLVVPRGQRSPTGDESASALPCAAPRSSLEGDPRRSVQAPSDTRGLRAWDWRGLGYGELTAGTSQRGHALGSDPRPARSTPSSSTKAGRS